MSSRTLGLDLGPNSIGWALIDESRQSIIDTGVRVFPEGVDNYETKKEQPKNQTRREARAARRQTNRRTQRKQLLREALVQAGLWPTDEDEAERLLRMDPYELRRRALDERLEPYEIGRVLLHLNQRRGFRSNRKADRDDQERKGMLAEIGKLEQAIQDSGSRTLGEYLDQLRRSRPDGAVRKLHTRRKMYENEFDKIWDAQQKYHPELLTERLKHGRRGRQQQPKQPEPRGKGEDLVDLFGIHGLIFFQRKLYWPASMIGYCELEPNKRRCPRADRGAQRFRMLQEVNNLRLIDPKTGEERPLSDGEWERLLSRLGQRKRMTFSQIRKALGFLETVEFNLEQGKRKGLQGHVTDAVLAGRKVFGTGWHDRTEEEKDRIVRQMVGTDVDEHELDRLAVEEWGIGQSGLDEAMKELPQGYAALSRDAIENLLPHLKRGLLYQTDDETPSALSEAGYLRRDQLRRRVFGELPRVELLANYRDLRHLSDLPNPIVRQVLYELRKVVNAIIREYGKPDQVHVELARDVKRSAKQREEITNRNRENEQRRERAREAAREQGQKPTREMVDRYLLWEEQGGLCLYSGEPIGRRQLFSDEVDVDHILPYSRSLDNSLANKALCFRSQNRQKGQQTVPEWLEEAAPTDYEQILQRADRYLPYNKRRKLRQKNVDLEQFVSRQLNDTAYISKAVAEYLGCLFGNASDVLCTKGQQTATLRRQWGLGTILRDLGDSPAWREGQDAHPGEKDRADHRHHAVDAIVVALTGRRRLQQLARSTRGDGIDPPWSGSRDEVLAKVGRINVSHRSRRKVNGPLHKETFYGPTDQDGVYAIRQPVESLTPAMVPNIRDEQVQRVVSERLRHHGIEPGRGRGSVPKKVWNDPLHMPSGEPIKRVRVTLPEQSIRPLRFDAAGRPTTYVKPGSNHHACIFEYEQNGKTKREAAYVSLLEARRRVKRREPIIQRTHPSRPEARFVMSVSPGDLLVAEFDGRERLLLVTTLVSTPGQNRIHVVDACDARPSSDRKDIGRTPNSLRARKVTVDPIGRLRDAEARRTSAGDQLDPQIAQLARQRVHGEISARKMKHRLREMGKNHLGAQLTAEIHRLRQDEQANS